MSPRTSGWTTWQKQSDSYLKSHQSEAVAYLVWSGGQGGSCKLGFSIISSFSFSTLFLILYFCSELMFKSWILTSEKSCSNLGGVIWTKPERTAVFPRESIPNQEWWEDQGHQRRMTNRCGWYGYSWYIRGWPQIKESCNLYTLQLDPIICNLDPWNKLRLICSNTPISDCGKIYSNVGWLFCTPVPPKFTKKLAVDSFFQLRELI